MFSIIKKYSYFIEKDLPRLELQSNQYTYYMDFQIKPKISKPKPIKDTNLYVIKVIAYNRIYYFYDEKENNIKLQKFENKKVWRILFN